jgi:hypothetical protein
MKQNFMKDACTAEVSIYSYDMSTCPVGQRCIMLGIGGVAQVTQGSTDPFWIAWAPLPKRDKAEEQRRGLFNGKNL